MSNRRTSAKRSSSSSTLEALLYPKYNSIRQEQKEQLKREIDFIKLKNKAYERNKQRIKEEEKTNETNAQENVMSFSPPPLFAPVATRPTPKLRINPYPGNPGGKGKTHKKKSHKNIGKSKKRGIYKHSAKRFKRI